MHFRFAVGLDQLVARALVQLTPPIERLREFFCRSLCRRLDEEVPVFRPGGTGRGQFGTDTVENSAHRQRGTTLQGLLLEHRGDIRPHRQTFRMKVQHVGNVRSQFLARFRQPNRVKMSLDQVPVCEIERGRPHDTTDHRVGLGEVVLVVRTLSGTVGDDQRRLSRPSGTARTLGVVRRRWGMFRR